MPPPVIPGPSEIHGLFSKGEWTGLCKPVNAELLLRKFLPSARNDDDLKRSRLQAWISLANQCEIPKDVWNRLWRGGRTIALRTVHRLVAGIGTPSVYGIGITIDPLHGVPVIPGSSVKGVTRSAIEPYVTSADTFTDLWYWMHPTTTPLPAAVASFASRPAIEILGAMFGKDTADAGGAAGRITFHDALPKPNSGKGYYELDVVTPHYGDYYQTGASPNDRRDPKPIVFPVVRAGVDFQFAVRLAPAARALVSTEQTAWLEAAKAMVNYALTTRGVGGKTGVGYGYFTA